MMKLEGGKTMKKTVNLNELVKSLGIPVSEIIKVIKTENNSGEKVNE